MRNPLPRGYEYLRKSRFYSRKRMSEPVHSKQSPHQRTVRPTVLAKRDAALWLEKLAWLMDSSIPLGSRWSIGLDGLLGLIPGIGDLAGSFLSTFIVIAAAQAGLPRTAVARMIVNVAVDTVLGAIPFLGDIFDFTFKANAKNIKIFRE